jgi:hypothetical protein
MKQHYGQMSIESIWTMDVRKQYHLYYTLRGKIRELYWQSTCHKSSQRQPPSIRSYSQRDLAKIYHESLVNVGLLFLACAFPLMI